MLQALNPLVCVGNGGGGGGGSPFPPSFSLQAANTGVTGFVSDPNVTVNTTTHKVTAPLVTASVNTQINVMAPPYNAAGDCSTDDSAAIIAAQTTALTFSPPAALYFPKPPGGCYLVSPIQWQGVSLIGQPAGQCTNSSGSPSQCGVTIKGKPGLDVLHVPDPTTTSTAFNPSWSMRDITLMTDGTAITSTYPHRWPGRWFDDTTATASSAVITTTNGEVSCGDVGQAIQINGAGSGGSNLVTTIASVAPCWNSDDWASTVTLATPALTSVTNGHTYISVLGLPVTTNIGNCAIAFDDVDGNPANWVNPSQKGNLGDDMKNVTLTTFGDTSNPCGIYTQGYAGPYQFNATDVNIQQFVYGVVQGTAELNSKYQPSSNDYQTWKHNWFYRDVYPWISYNGGFQNLEDWQLTTQAGPQFLQDANNQFDGFNNAKISIPEMETFGTPTTYGMRLEGLGHVIQNTAFGDSGMTSYINTNQLKCVQCEFVGMTLQLGGTLNWIDVGTQIDTTTVNDTGRGNNVKGSYVANPYKGFPRAYPFAMIPKKGDFSAIGRVTADAIFDGNYTTLYNHNDLLFWPQDFIVNPAGSYSTYLTFDSASPSGAEFILNNTVFPLNFTQFPFASTTQQLLVGTNLPAGQANVYFMAKCQSPTTSFTLNVKTSTNTVVGTTTQACNTTLQNYTMTADFTAVSGQAVGFTGGNANNVLVAWIAIRPYIHDVNSLLIPGPDATNFAGFVTISGTSAPSLTCSATSDVGVIAVNATPTAYQCSNATGSYAWNTLGGGGGGSGTVSNCSTQYAFFYAAATGTTATCDGNLTDNGTQFTFALPVSISGTGASQIAFTYNATPLVPGSSTTAVVGANSSGQGVLSEAGAAAGRICTATNGVCPGGGGGGYTNVNGGASSNT